MQHRKTKKHVAAQDSKLQLAKQHSFNDLHPAVSASMEASSHQLLNCTMKICARLLWNLIFHSLNWVMAHFEHSLKNYAGQKTPDESTIRKNYLPKLYQHKLAEIRGALDLANIGMSVDGTTDAAGWYLAIVGEIQCTCTQRIGSATTITGSSGHLWKWKTQDPVWRGWRRASAGWVYCRRYATL